MNQSRKLFNDMTDEEKFEIRVSNLINTSIDDARSSIPFSKKEVLVEALRREKERKFPRVTLIKILVSAIRNKS